MITAKELMHTNTPNLFFDTTVETAFDFFRTNPHSFAVVSASADRLHGVLTEGGLMRIYMKYQSYKDRPSLIFYRDMFEPAQLVLETEEFPSVVKKVMTSIGNRVFVINQAGEMVGHITAKDILPYFSANNVSMQKSKVGEGIHSDMFLYQSFFTKSPFLMHSANQKGEIQMANEILHRILGYEYGDLIGKTIFDIYPKENHEKAREGLKTILDQGYHKIIKAEMIRKDGSHIEIEMASRALVDPAGKPVGTITISRPIQMESLLEVLPEI